MAFILRRGLPRKIACDGVVIATVIDDALLQTKGGERFIEFGWAVILLGLVRDVELAERLEPRDPR
ncbi:MAG: hypothetical protein ACOYNF_03485 [Rhodoferax sp.]